MTTKGKLTPELSAVLRNKEARDRLRHAMDTGENLTIRIGETTYRISTLRNQRTVHSHSNGAKPKGKRLAKA